METTLGDMKQYISISENNDGVKRVHSFQDELHFKLSKIKNRVE